jgi:hypothetical protein
MSAATAAVSLVLAVVSLLAFPIGAIFALFLVGLFLLALAGVFSGLDDRSVPQRKPRLDGRRWRNGPLAHVTASLLP